MLAIPGGAIFVAYTYAPEATPTTFNLFCTYPLAYRLNVTIEAGGKQYSSTAVRRFWRARSWRSLIPGACDKPLGTALAFRLDDNRLVLIGAYICPKAQKAMADKRDHFQYPDDFTDAMKEQRKVDVASHCVGVVGDQPPTNGLSTFQGFVIDNADHPARWRGLAFNSDNVAENIRIVSAVAIASHAAQEDQLDTVAPAILKTSFNGDWSSSPEPLIDFHRRYDAEKRFRYEADQDRP
jgi:hypothetical protein